MTFDPPLSGRVRTYISHYLLYSHGHRTLVSTLSLGVGVVNRLLSNQRGPPPVQVESLKLAFQIIATLLDTPSEVRPHHTTQPPTHCLHTGTHCFGTRTHHPVPQARHTH